VVDGFALKLRQSKSSSKVGLSKGLPGGEVAVKWKVRDCTALAKFNISILRTAHSSSLTTTTISPAVTSNVNIDHDSSRWSTTITHAEMESQRITEAEAQAEAEVLQDPSVPSPEMPGHKLDNPEM
jgi:hypothetical protein